MWVEKWFLFFYSPFFSLCFLNMNTHMCVRARVRTHTHPQLHTSSIRSLLMHSGIHSSWKELTIISDWVSNSKEARISANYLKGRGKVYTSREKRAEIESLEPTWSWSCLDFGTGVGEGGAECPYEYLWTAGSTPRGTSPKRAWAARKECIVK